MSTFELSLYGALSSPELPGLLRKLCRLTGDLIQGHNYAEQDLVYVPLVETPFGPKRNDDVVLRLQSSFVDDQTGRFIPLQDRDWTLAHLAPPEPPKSKLPQPNIRSVTKSHLNSSAFQLLAALGYTYSFEVLRKGYKFMYGSTRILLYQPLKPIEPYRVSTAVHASPETFLWIVSVTSPLISQEQIPRWSAELLGLADMLKGTVDVGPVDHTCLVNRIQYRS